MIPNRPSYSLRGAWLLRTRQPLVYVWRRGARVLYVGLGRSGLTRPLAPSHHRLQCHAIEPDDHLDIYECCSAGEAIGLERALIDARSPELNRKYSPPENPDDPNVHAVLRRRIRETERQNSDLYGLIGRLSDALRDIANGATDPVRVATDALADEDIEMAKPDVHALVEEFCRDLGIR